MKRELRKFVRRATRHGVVTFHHAMAIFALINAVEFKAPQLERPLCGRKS